MLTLPDRACSLDAELDERLAELGITGFHEMELEDGRRFRVPAYFEAVIAALAVSRACSAASPNVRSTHTAVSNSSARPSF